MGTKSVKDKDLSKDEGLKNPFKDDLDPTITGKFFKTNQGDNNQSGHHTSKQDTHDATQAPPAMIKSSL